MAARTAADGKWVRRIARTAADGVGAREWLEMGGEKKLLGMSELGCTDGCGRSGCKGVAGNGLGEQAWKMVACWLAMCAYRLTDKIDARGWGQGMMETWGRMICFFGFSLGVCIFCI